MSFNIKTGSLKVDILEIISYSTIYLNLKSTGEIQFLFIAHTINVCYFTNLDADDLENKFTVSKS